MSDNLPPQPPGGQPGPWGPPPTQPLTGQREYGPGQPVTPGGGTGGGKRLALAGGGLLLAGALVAGGFVAVSALNDGEEGPQGAQPSDALPADTLGYLSVDLDPSGRQKIEAVTTLRKFPAFEEEMGIEADGDIRKRVFELGQEDSGMCQELDFDEDVDPWLGNRFGMGAVEAGGDGPEPVLVVQVDDVEGARAGIAALAECSDAEGEYGLAFVGDEWALITEEQAAADDVATRAGEASLTDDEEFERWTDASGEPGIVHMYAAPELGDYLLEHGDDFFGSSGEAFGSEDGEFGSSPAPSVDELPEDVKQALEDFSGAAATLRFSDGALEIEFASGKPSGIYGDLAESTAGGEAVATLPTTTAAAMGLALPEGWLDMVLEQLAPMMEMETGMSPDEALAELERETGLTKDDIEALGGESVAVAVDSDFDPSEIQGMEDPRHVPVGLKIKGDTERIEAALDKIRARMGSGAAEFLLSEASGDYVVVSASPDYLAKLTSEDGLGDADSYTSLVASADEANQVFFVDFNAGDDWLDRLVSEMGAPREVLENVEPLAGVGMSSWLDGDEVHGVLKLTTD